MIRPLHHFIKRDIHSRGKAKSCPHCQGTGDGPEYECRWCQGTGKDYEDEDYT